MSRSSTGDRPPTGAAPDWRARLRAGGYRMTPQRQLVLEAVARLGHATPDEVASDVQAVSSAVNISTVYRTLELLEQLGLVTHSHLGHGAPSYSPATASDHVHLVCRACGDVLEESPSVVSELVEQLSRNRGFAVDVGHLTIFGLCRRCGPDDAATRTTKGW